MYLNESHPRKSSRKPLAAKAQKLLEALLVWIWVVILCIASSMNAQIVHEEIKTGVSSESASVTTSASLSGVSGDLYLAAISTKARLHLDGVSGLGLNWTLLKKQCGGRGSTMVELWMAQGTPSGDGPVTAHFPAATSNAVIVVSHYSGVNSANPIGNVISGSTNGEDGGCTGGTDGSTYSFNLPTAGDDAVVYAAVAVRSRPHSPGGGYTEQAEIMQGTPNAAAGIAVVDKQIASVSSVTVNGSLSGVTDWAVAAVEIMPSGGGTTSVNTTLASPSTFQLEQNYPNPFNPSTVINFSLPAAGNVRLRVYDLSGQLVRTLVSGEMPAGQHSVRWHGDDAFNRFVAAGMYFYKIEVEGKNSTYIFAQTRRMLFLK
ncbi:MAG: FlgD immunoglobulin-like domain containing protein [bacterium]